MEHSRRRGPSGIFMALVGICTLALLVAMIYGVAISNPELVRMIMGTQDTGAQSGYTDGMDGGYYDNGIYDNGVYDNGMVNDSTDGIDITSNQYGNDTAVTADAVG